MSKLFKVFVYGTLKKGGRFAKDLSHKRKSCVKAVASGKMYNIGSFPGVNFSERGDVYGEIHEFPKSILKRLDQIEGFIEEGNMNNLYHRKKIIVLKDSNRLEEITCWSYEFNFATYPRVYDIVENGIWKV